MSNQRSRLDRLEGHRRGTADRCLVDDLAARHGIDAGSLRAETARVLERAAAGGWSVDDELRSIAAESGRSVAAVRAEHRRILEGVGR